MLVVKSPLANVGDIRDTGSILGSERYPREGHGNPLQYSCLEDPIDRGAWRSMVYDPWVHKESGMTEGTWHAHTGVLILTLSLVESGVESPAVCHIC